VFALIVVILDESFDQSFEVAMHGLVFQKDAVLECVVPAFDFVLF
jgi:hypothetical protein